MAAKKTMADDKSTYHALYPHTKDDLREKKKREKPGGKKAGKIEHKGDAGTSNKARGGKMAR